MSLSARQAMENKFFKNRQMTKDRTMEIALESKMRNIEIAIKQTFKKIDKSIDIAVDKQFKPYYDSIASLNNYIIRKFLDDM